MKVFTLRLIIKMIYFFVIAETALKLIEEDSNIDSQLKGSVVL